MNKCVFLDRDGVINYAKSWVNKIEEFELIPATLIAIKRFKMAGFGVVVITNQGGIECGYQTEEGLGDLHSHMQMEVLKATSFKFDGIFYCPHYEEPCDCRKPKPGMIWQAAVDLEINLGNSFMIGDREGDKEAGINAGCRCAYQITPDQGISGELVNHIINSSE